MGISALWKALQIVTTVSAWSQKALDDGKVTLTEATELATDLCGVLGIPLEIDLGDK